MIIFEQISYKNFLATGDVPIVVDLNTHASTLIVGRNGAGKSTMTEALCFALFGQALRNINKPALVNSVNKRDALVELTFRINGARYRVIRGIKPNIFEIYENDVLIPSPAALADYQSLFETQILKLNYKSFRQIVVLGSASYVPFMRLSPAARREIIEDILDIEVFSAMSSLAKDEFSTLKTKTDTLVHQKTLLDEQVRMGESFTAQLDEERDAQLAKIRAAIEQEMAEIERLTGDRVVADTQTQTYAPTQDTYTHAREKLSQLENTYRALLSREKKLQKEREFYTAHDECPTCAQSIASEFKTHKISHITHKEQDAQRAQQQCQSFMAGYTQSIAESETLLSECTALKKEIEQIDYKLPIHRRRVAELKIELTRPAQQAPVVDLDEIRNRITATVHEQHTTAQQRSIVESAAMLLKDNGIKARVIKHYLPVINTHINKYLTAMDFPIHFNLDEEFKERIESRHRDDFSYDSFSEGEKKRIDLALLLTWRAIARLKNSSSCNVLVLDEVFDSSLDVSGTEEFLKIIHALENANIFVISHKTDSLVDKFSNVLHYEKHRGFSTLKK